MYDHDHNINPLFESSSPPLVERRHHNHHHNHQRSGTSPVADPADAAVALAVALLDPVSAVAGLGEDGLDGAALVVDDFVAHFFSFSFFFSFDLILLRLSILLLLNLLFSSSSALAGKCLGGGD